MLFHGNQEKDLVISMISPVKGYGSLAVEEELVGSDGTY